MRWTALAAWLALTAPAVAADIPLQEFARHPQYEDAQLSPDGQYLAAVAVVDGKRMLSLIHLTDLKGVNVAPRGDDELAEFDWAGPDRLVYSVGTREAGKDRPIATGELFGVDANGKNNVLLFGYRVATQQAGTHLNVAKAENASAQVIATLPSDPKHVVVLVQPWGNGIDPPFPDVRRMDVRDGKTVRMYTAPLREPRSIVADYQGNLRFMAGEDAQGRWQVFYRDTDAKAWEKVLDEASDSLRATPWRLDRAGTTAYWACPTAGAAGAVCTWSTRERQLKPVWSDPLVTPLGLVTSLDGGDVVGVRAMPGRISVGVLDKSSDAMQLLKAVMPQFAGDDVQIVSRARDGSRAVLLVQSDVNPGEYYLYDKASRKLDLLFARWPALKPEALAPMEPVQVKARDGQVLLGYVTRPPGKAGAKGLPLVVLVHGGPYGVRDEWNYDPDVQVLASRGYAVLQVNFRGSGGRGYAFQQAGHRQWGRLMQDDVTDATRWAIAEGVADPARVCIMGASYGGYAALEGAVKEPDLYRCAIGEAGVYDLTTLRSTTDAAKSTSNDNYWKRVLGEDDAALAQVSPLRQIDRLKARVMLAVGGEDRRVPPEQGMALHAALESRHVAHEYLYERTEGHGYYDEAHRAELYAKVLAFLDANIGARDGAAAASAK